MARDFTDAQLKSYAESLIFSHIEDIEGLTIYEMADTFFDADQFSDPDGLSREDMERVRDFLYSATVKVTWDA